MPKGAKKAAAGAPPADTAAVVARVHHIAPASSYHNTSLAFVPPSPEHAGAAVRPGAGGSPGAPPPMPDLKEFVGQLPTTLALHTNKVRPLDSMVFALGWGWWVGRGRGPGQG